MFLHYVRLKFNCLLFLTNCLIIISSYYMIVVSLTHTASSIFLTRPLILLFDTRSEVTFFNFNSYVFLVTLVKNNPCFVSRSRLNLVNPFLWNKKYLMQEIFSRAPAYLAFFPISELLQTSVISLSFKILLNSRWTQIIESRHFQSTLNSS